VKEPLAPHGEELKLSADHAERLANGIEQYEASFITPKGDGWLTLLERQYIAGLLRQAARSETGPMLFVNGDTRAEIPAGKKEAVFAKLVAFFNNHKCWTSESFGQSDGPQIGSMDLMCDILDTIDAKVTYDE
jgi:hypothetical protein